MKAENFLAQGVEVAIAGLYNLKKSDIGDKSWQYPSEEIDRVISNLVVGGEFTSEQGRTERVRLGLIPGPKIHPVKRR